MKKKMLILTKLVEIRSDFRSFFIYGLRNQVEGFPWRAFLWNKISLENVDAALCGPKSHRNANSRPISFIQRRQRASEMEIFDFMSKIGRILNTQKKLPFNDFPTENRTEQVKIQQKNLESTNNKSSTIRM